MHFRKKLIFYLLALPVITVAGAEPLVISYVVDPGQSEIRMYWQDDKGKNFKNFRNLDTWLGVRNKKLIFAMNGGMFKQDLSPQGLYIEDGKILRTIDISTGTGNFYLKPNGVFYILKSGRVGISSSQNIESADSIQFATQSGPMLVLDGTIHHSFRRNSKNLHIRNGVGLLPDGKIVFAISREKINFFDFARFFQREGCKNALYLDGFVSRIYLPEKKIISSGEELGVIIGVIRKDLKTVTE